MVPQNGQWSSVIRQVYKDAAKPIVRYALKKEYDIFDREKLMKMSRILPAGYEIRMIDERIYHMAGKEEWSSDLCSQFPTFADYRERGIGTAVLFDGTLAAGASSYIRAVLKSRSIQRRNTAAGDLPGHAPPG